uniref:C2H2-type domain-containing protein n=1 Tax=Steinernema glaseri TaxID=37863 RepID=A0A1I7ZDD7_9BILA
MQMPGASSTYPFDRRTPFRLQPAASLTIGALLFSTLLPTTRVAVCHLHEMTEDAAIMRPRKMLDTYGHPGLLGPAQETPSAPPPVVICPTELDSLNITLEKNQQCQCKDCGKLFNSVWYLKQHAVKHSNDRPFQCKFCLKTYKFRSNLYQHKCPERTKSLGNGPQNRLYRRGFAYTEVYNNGAQPSTIPPAPTVHHQQSVTYTTTMHNTPGGQFGYGEQQSNEGSLPSVNSMFPELHFAYGAKVFHEEPEPEPVVVTKPQDTIREQQWSQTVIDRYLERNKAQLFECTRCNIYFATEQYLYGHLAQHQAADERILECGLCPQRFLSPFQLERHREMHSADAASSRVCGQCHGLFRSSLALRKHRLNCPSCQEYPFGVKPQLMVSPSAPIDRFGFVTSDAEDETEEENALSAIPVSDELKERQKTSDSGLGSDSSNHSLTTSPARSSHLEDDFDATSFARKDDDEESGFRSRLHSTCSPASSSAYSPLRGSSGGPVYTSRPSVPLHHPYRQNHNGYQSSQDPFDRAFQTSAPSATWPVDKGYMTGPLENYRL